MSDDGYTSEEASYFRCMPDVPKCYTKDFWGICTEYQGNPDEEYDQVVYCFDCGKKRSYISECTCDMYNSVFLSNSLQKQNKQKGAKVIKNVVEKPTGVMTGVTKFRYAKGPDIDGKIGFESRKK